MKALCVDSGKAPFPDKAGPSRLLAHRFNGAIQDTLVLQCVRDRITERIPTESADTAC